MGPERHAGLHAHAPQALLPVAHGLVEELQFALAARQLNLEPTGHGPGGGTSNFHLEKGKLSPDALIADIKSGLYITDLIGFGVNAVTGDYSRGASGFWIENGKKTYPVSGITVAGNLKDMFLNMTPASDLQFKSATNAPTVRIEGMTIASS